MQPTVIHPIGLAGFVQFVLDHHSSPSALIVCSSEEDFLHKLSISTDRESRRDQDEDEADGPPSRPTDTQRPIELSSAASIKKSKHALLIPTLHQISGSQTLKLAFCSSPESLRAYLSVYGMKNDPPRGTENSSHRAGSHDQPVLALLNPVAIHRGTSSFSAQGLSRTFASAVEAACRADQRLIIAECRSSVRIQGPEGLEMSDDDREVEIQSDGDPWDQQVAMLNVTTKSFGAGERGWVGRTVKAKAVVQRWCSFIELSDHASQIG